MTAKIQIISKARKDFAFFKKEKGLSTTFSS